MTKNLTNVETLNGTVHRGRDYGGGRLGPACRKYQIHQLHACFPIDEMITCKRCIAKFLAPPDPRDSERV